MYFARSYTRKRYLNAAGAAQRMHLSEADFLQKLSAEEFPNIRGGQHPATHQYLIEEDSLPPIKPPSRPKSPRLKKSCRPKNRS